MSDANPPVEQQRFARAQTPESPLPLHRPEPSNIPVLLNQMDPVFNDTTTYNIPSNQTFSPYADTLENANLHNSSTEEPDPVQDFFREAENQAAVKPVMPNSHHALPSHESDQNHSESMATSDNPNASQTEDVTSALQSLRQTNAEEAKTVEKETDNQSLHDGDHGGLTNEGHDSQSADIKSSDTISSEQSAQGVDYQSLLDTISQSTSTAPLTSGTTATVTEPIQLESSTTSLPVFSGLPPKPPPQNSLTEFPSYSTTAQPNSFDFSAQIPLGTNQATIQNMQNDPNDQSSSNIGDASQSFAIANEHTTNLFPSDIGILPTSQIAPSSQPLVAYPRPPQGDPNASDPADRPWTPQTQSLYDEFLENERRYVTEGIWDRFPAGSRLFVGNLPSEKVTKRDLFHRFHRHGRLAQISIKQAYGFVQYHDAESCLKALNAEEGVEIRGRKIHLEVSRPQKNDRAAGSRGNKTQARRRSRSPERNHRRSSEFRDDTSRRRDDFRNRRSPSPRSHHGRAGHRPDNRDDRRSPAYGSSYGTPQSSNYDDEASLPIPRRDPRSVPDVQLIVIDQGVHQSFINWVEEGLRRKGLQAMTVWLGQRLSLAAVIKRQIVEGVQAVVKLSSAAQAQSKIPLQVFDRTAGASNVHFNEYADLDVQVAADVVIQARQRERGQMQAPFQQGFQPPNPHVQPPPPMPYPLQIPQHYPGNPPQHTPNTPYQYLTPNQGQYRPPVPGHNSSGAVNQSSNLQELLANLKGSPNPSTPQSAQSMANGRPDLAALMGGRPPNNQQSPAPYGMPSPYPNYSPGSATQQHYGGQPGHNQQPISPQQSVQDIMQQLARFQR